MIKLYILLLTTTLFSCNLKKTSSFDLSVFDTHLSTTNKKSIKNDKIRCRVVCDKKIYKEQKIADAISFYKNSKEYNKSWR